VPALIVHTDDDAGSIVIATAKPDVAVAAGVYVLAMAALVGAVEVKVMLWVAWVTGTGALAALVADQVR
jgi:hypothetical protein